MLFTDLVEIRKILEIDPLDHSEDAKLSLLIEQCSSWIEELLNRPGFSYKQRTEFYAGTQTPMLLLKSRPVYAVVNGSPAITAIVDQQGYYGSAPGSFDPSAALVYGQDFCLKIDQDDGNKSRCGILLRINNIWPRPTVRAQGYLSPFISTDPGSIKVTYYGGYTVDDLPGCVRLAMNLLVARLRLILPEGMETQSENYEERGVAIVTSEKAKLLALVAPILIPNMRNFKW